MRMVKRTDFATPRGSPPSAGRSPSISAGAHLAQATREKGGLGREPALQGCKTPRTWTRPRPRLLRRPSAAPLAPARRGQQTRAMPVREHLGCAGSVEGEVQSTPRPHQNEWGSCARHERKTHFQYSSENSAVQGRERGAQHGFPGDKYL